MENILDKLFYEWHNLGAAVLVLDSDYDIPTRKPEEVIAESTNWCRYSSRLTWIIIDWLIKHIDEIDDFLLLEITKAKGVLSVLGLICDAARQKYAHPKLNRIVKDCPPNQELEIFFHRVAKSDLASRLARENALPLFKKWNFISNELRYLDEPQKEEVVI